MNDSPDYAKKKAFFNRMLTVYGRKPVLESLLDEGLQVHALHLAQSNKPARILTDILEKAQSRDVAVSYHDRAALARISKNGKQDQGVALDIVCPGFQDLDDFLGQNSTGRLLALDGITNPQNLGMIVRSATAGAIDGILLPKQGTAALGPLVIKASAGTLYRAPILRCDSLAPALERCREQGAEICTLDAAAPTSLFEHRGNNFCIYVLGNESDGVSPAVTAMAHTRLGIPMRGGVESLNVAVTASLVAFAGDLAGAYPDNYLDK